MNIDAGNTFITNVVEEILSYEVFDLSLVCFYT